MLIRNMIFLLFLYTVGFTQYYKIDSGFVKVSARSSIIGIEDEFDAIGTALSGFIDFSEKKFNLKFNLWDLDTGIELRNEHMHSNYLETENYPDALFEGTLHNISINKIKVTGVFNLHDVSQPLQIDVIRRKNQISATWQLNLEDYNIEIPTKFIVAKLNKILKISVELNLSQ